MTFEGKGKTSDKRSDAKSHIAALRLLKTRRIRSRCAVGGNATACIAASVCMFRLAGGICSVTGLICNPLLHVASKSTALSVEKKGRSLGWRNKGLVLNTINSDADEDGGSGSLAPSVKNVKGDDSTDKTTESGLCSKVFLAGDRNDGHDSFDETLSHELSKLSYETYFDEDDCEGELCMLSHPDESSFPTLSIKERRFTRVVDEGLRYIPVLSPVVAFFTYEGVAKAFELFVEVIAKRNWVAVDGGAYQTQIITPAINGIVLPAIAILFATLISNTVTTLRQRQQDIRTTLNIEAGEIRVLQAMVDSFPPEGDAQDKCRAYLIQYVTRIIEESRPNVEMNTLEFTGSMDSEMNGFLAELNSLSSDSVNGVSPSPQILSESYGAVTRLNAERSTRISALQTTYPVLHYSILTALALSICVAFLMESNQELLIFLNAIQLKILWTMLIGTFSALAVVCYDLNDAFRGSYQISRSVDQLHTIRDTIRATDQMKKADISSRDD